jgi:hypothetical protein
MLLDATTRKLQALLSGAAATTNPQVIASWVDTTTTAVTPGVTPSNLNGGTAVDIVAAPGGSTYRKITFVSILNIDTASVTVTVRLNDNTTLYKIVTVTLLTNEMLCYSDSAGWYTLDASGNIKQAASGAANNSYRVILDASGSHTAAKTAAVYGLGQGDPLAVTGTGTLYPLNMIYLAAADFPTVAGLGTKLKIKANVHCNDVAPTGTYIFGLYPVTRPATSGGAGLCIYTLGTVVSGSQTATVNAPAADSSTQVESSDFAIPADGYYCIGCVTTGTVAASAHMHMSTFLLMRNN